MNPQNSTPPNRPLKEWTDEEVIAFWNECGQNAMEMNRRAPHITDSSFRTRLLKIHGKNPRVLEAERHREKMARLKALDDALEAKGIDPRDVDIRSAKIAEGSWDTTMKLRDEDGVDHVHKETNLRTGVEVIFMPKSASGPKWPLIQPAPKQIVKYVRSSAPLPSIGNDLERVLIIPDAQIGYLRHLVSDKLEPFHDVRAISLMLKIIADFKPHRIVILGDFLDCASLSKYLQIAEFQLTFQPSIYYAAWLLGMIRSAAGPTCVIDYLAGNHERRVSEYIARNALAAHAIRRAPDEWPVMSVPFLLGLDKLNIRYSDEYPGGQVWLTKKLVCRHQPTTAKQDLRASEISGHHPTYKVESHTVWYHDGPVTYEQHTIPGLMRIDDSLSDPTRLVRTAVPSDRTKLNWSQGIGVVYIRNEDHFKVDTIKIVDGYAMFEGREYHADADFPALAPAPAAA